MSAKVHDGYEVTSKSIDSKLAEQKKGSQEEKFLKKLKEEKFKSHLQKQDEAEKTLTAEEIRQQEQAQQELIAEKSLKEQEKKRKAAERGFAIDPVSVADLEFIQPKQFDLGEKPQTLAAKPQATNLQTQQVAKYYDHNSGGLSH